MRNKFFLHTFIICLLVLFFAVNNINTVKAAGEKEIVIAEIEEFFDAGAEGFLLWLYSGDRAKSFGADQYSFYRGDAVGQEMCEALKEMSDKYPNKFVGVNIRDAGAHTAELGEHFSHLKNSCGVKVVRYFVTERTNGSESEKLREILNIANSTGIQIIPVIGNFLGDDFIPGQMNADETIQWYSSGYQSPWNQSLSYRQHAQNIKNAMDGNPGPVYAVELLNEPHCRGRGDTQGLTAYRDWGVDIGNIFRGYNVGYGQKASESTTKCDSPGVDFSFTNAPSQITVTSAHYYNQTEKKNALKALEDSLSLGKPFYIGEFSFENLEEEPVETDFETEDCAIEKPGAASSGCLLCGAVGEVFETRSGIEKILAGIRSFFLPGGLLRYKVALENISTDPQVECNPTIGYRDGGSEIKKTWLFGPKVCTTYNIKADFEASKLESELGIGRHSQFTTVVSPQKADKIIASLGIMENEQDVREFCYRVQGGSSGCIETTIKGALSSTQAVAGLMSNALWATPGKPLAQSPPPGLTLEEYLGEELAMERKQYLAQETQKFLAKNYSNQEKADLAFTIQEERDKSFQDKYVYNKKDPSNTKVSSNISNNNIQKAAISSPQYNNSACTNPNTTATDTSCAKPLSDDGYVFEVTVEDNYDCDGSIDANGNPDLDCQVAFHEIEVADHHRKYTGDDVDAPSGYAETITSEAAIEQAREVAVARGNNIELVATDDTTTNTQFNIGTVESLGTFAYVIAPPAPKSTQSNGVNVPTLQTTTPLNAGTFNKSLSSERDPALAKVGGSGGNLTVRSLVLPKENFEAECSPRLTYMIGQPPNAEENIFLGKRGQEAKLMKDYFMSSCVSLILPPEESICESKQIIVNNNTTNNYTIVDSNDNSVLGNIGDQGNFLDSSSDLNIKLAFRYVDGATLIMSNGKDIVPRNPGSGVCNYYGTDKGLQIIWLPLGYDPDDNDNWKDNAYTLEVKMPGGYTQVELDLNVKEGHFRIDERGDNCFNDNIRIEYPASSKGVPMTPGRMMDRQEGYFTLLNQSEVQDEKAFCAKITKNVAMEGGDSTRDSFGSCSLSIDYDLSWNSACGGGRDGDPEDGDFWPRVFGSPEDYGNGLQAYKEIFGRDLESIRSSLRDEKCKDVFPSTMFKVNCGNANNSDIHTTASINSKNNNITVGLPTVLPINDLLAKFYTPTSVSLLKANANQQVKEALNNCPTCKIAAFREEDLGRKMCVVGPNGEQQQVIIVTPNTQGSSSLILEQSTFNKLGGDSQTNTTISGVTLQENCN